jgi:hypothetical protein
MNEKELQNELEMSIKRWGNWFAIRECIKCNNKFVGGTTAQVCRDCYHRKMKEKSIRKAKNRRIKMLNLTKEKDHCFFCKKTDKLDIHHIDKDTKNNSKENLMLLCRGCHKKLHGRVYNPLLKRLFSTLIDERMSYHEIGKKFGTTRQNVYNILNK